MESFGCSGGEIAIIGLLNLFGLFEAMLGS